MRMVSSKHTLVPVLLSVAFIVGAAAIPSSAKTTITMMTHTHAPFNKWVKDKIAEYQKLHPEVEIKYTYILHEQFDPKILTMVAAGSAPDILNLYSPTFVDFIRSRFIDTPPPPVQDDLKNNFLPDAIKGMKVDGTYWGYPTEAIVMLPVANETVFEQAGMAYPDSYEDLVNVQRKLTVKDAAGKVTRVGVGYPGSGPWLIKGWSSFVWGYGGDIIKPKENKAAFNTPEGTKATLYYKEISSVPAPSGGFEKDKQGVMLNGSYYRPPQILAKAKHRYRALPAPKGVDGVRVANSYYWGMMVTKMSKHKKEAWDFVRWLNTPQNKLDLTKDVEYPPLTKYERDHFKEDKWMSTFSDEMVNGRTLPQVKRWNAIEQAIVTRLQSYVSGKVLAPDQALRLAEQDTNNFLARSAGK